MPCRSSKISLACLHRSGSPTMTGTICVSVASTGRPAFRSAALVAATAARWPARSTPDLLRWAIEAVAAAGTAGGQPAVLFGDSGAARSIHANGMYLVQIGHGVIVLGKVADRGEWGDVAVHRIDALEHDQLGPAWRGPREQLLQMLEIVVAPDLPGTASGTYAFDHRIMVERIGQDQAVRK